MSSDSFSGWGMLARLYWCAVAPCLWLLLLVPIAQADHALDRWDALFAMLVVSMCTIRHVEWRSGGATTLYGEPTTSAIVKRYAVQTVLISGAVWGVAKFTV